MLIFGIIFVMSIDLSGSKTNDFEVYLVQDKILIYADKKLFIDHTIEVDKDININFNKVNKINHISIYNRLPIDLIIDIDIDFNDLNCDKLDIYNFSNMPVWLFDSNVNFLKMYNSSTLCMSKLSTVNHMFITISKYYPNNILESNISCSIGCELEYDNITLLIGNEWCKCIENNVIINYISPYIL